MLIGPPGEKLALVLRAMVCQTLVHEADGLGRVPACELLLGTPPVEALIREGKLNERPRPRGRARGRGVGGRRANQFVVQRRCSRTRRRSANDRRRR